MDRVVIEVYEFAWRQTGCLAAVLQPWHNRLDFFAWFTGRNLIRNSSSTSSTKTSWPATMSRLTRPRRCSGMDSMSIEIRTSARLPACRTNGRWEAIKADRVREEKRTHSSYHRLGRMTKTKKDDEIMRALIADASNPDAWEHVAVVPPSTSPRPEWYGKSRKPQEARAKRPAPRQPQVDPASREAEARRRTELHDAIAALSDGQRHAMQLWLDGFHYTEIANALGVSVDAVKSRLGDAKRHLPHPALNEASGYYANRNVDRTGGAKGR